MMCDGSLSTAMSDPRRLPVRAIGAAALCAMLAFSGAQPAAAQDGASFLERLAGAWQGRGTVRRSAGAAAEPVSCRFSGARENGAATLSMRYICLGIDLKVETTGALQNAGNGRYTGWWHTVGAPRRAEGAGARSGDRLRLSLDGVHPETSEPMRSELVFDLNGQATFDNHLDAVDPKTGATFRAFSATFRR